MSEFRDGRLRECDDALDKARLTQMVFLPKPESFKPVQLPPKPRNPLWLWDAIENLANAMTDKTPIYFEPKKHP